MGKRGAYQSRDYAEYRRSSSKGGEQEVIELHGSSLRNRCLKCGAFFPLEYILSSEGAPRCGCGGLIKPDVVLYGESLDSRVLRRAAEEISAADTLIVGGTSLAVYPAASFVYAFRGKNLVVVNNSPTGADGCATLVFRENIADVFSRL